MSFELQVMNLLMTGVLLFMTAWTFVYGRPFEIRNSLAAEDKALVEGLQSILETVASFAATPPDRASIRRAEFRLELISHDFRVKSALNDKFRRLDDKLVALQVLFTETTSKSVAQGVVISETDYRLIKDLLISIKDIISGK